MQKDFAGIAAHIIPACERVEYDGTRVVYKLDPFGVNNNESIQ